MGFDWKMNRKKYEWFIIAYELRIYSFFYVSIFLILMFFYFGISIFDWFTILIRKYFLYWYSVHLIY